MRYVVSYDVPEDRRRRRLASFLERHAWRVQWSVFEAEWVAAQAREIFTAATTLIDPQTGGLRLYPLCEQCQRGVLLSGAKPPDGDETKPLIL